MARYEFNIQTGRKVELPDLPAPPAAEPSAAEAQAPYIAALDGFIDMVALRRGYDTRYTCALRAAYPGPFQAEGLAFAQWMDACYVAGQTVLSEVLAGKREQPTVDDFLKTLPVMVWPEAAQ
ncbi:hypothetical protein KBW71_03230 [Hydrogenophaga aromaticivorans]|uniref:hypothetical protein n=1 Tax=Hydrogenophaga aromaticivorans TaxID=2610898 RepID=UPI001B375D0D|nr:hypothetical protein [Hydrogenophaga aromaticivorans]MBQ0917441.1 hypothetical protein [Hydrogenophaga aromaticivorans]